MNLRLILVAHSINASEIFQIVYYLTGVCIWSNCKRWCYCNLNIYKKNPLWLDADSCQWNKLSFNSSIFCTFCSSGNWVLILTFTLEFGFDSSTSWQVCGNPIKKVAIYCYFLKQSSNRLLLLKQIILISKAASDYEYMYIFVVPCCFRNENCFVDVSTDRSPML